MAQNCYNLFSVGWLVVGGYNVLFSDEGAEVFKRDTKEVVLRVPFDGKLWRLKYSVDHTSSGDAMLLAEKELSTGKKESATGHLRLPAGIEETPIGVQVSPRANMAPQISVGVIRDAEKSPSESGECIKGAKDDELRGAAACPSAKKRKTRSAQEELTEKKRKLEEPKKELGMLWHRRIGHANAEYLRILSTKVDQMKKAEFGKQIAECEDCLRGKFSRLPCNRKRTRADLPLKLVHSDVMCGLPSSFQTRRSYLTL